MSYPFVQAHHDLGRARGPRLAIAWHMAEGGGTVGFLSRLNQHGVAVHFVIEYTGRIVQMLKIDHMHSSIRTTAIRRDDDAAYIFEGVGIRYGRTAALAALGSWADAVHGTLGPNHATIGVELEGFAAKGPNARQAAAIAALATELDLPANLGHRDFADYKGCPGKLFPWPAAGGHGRVTVTAEDPTMLTPGALIYLEAVRPIVGRPIRSSTQLSAPIIRPAREGDEFPRLGDDGAWFAVRIPGNTVAYIHHPDGVVVATPLAPADCAAQDAKLAKIAELAKP